MHHDDSPAERRSGSKPTIAESEREYQRAVLSLILREHPIQLSGEELGRELTLGGRSAEIDAVELAVDSLVGFGLLRRVGASVLPTRAALAFESLESQ